MRYTSDSPETTERIAAALAATLAPGDCVALFGGLGAGKTAFVRGLARVLAPGAEVSSPTFALVHDYGGLLHYDMYRVESFDALYSTGYFDEVGGENILAIEWSENIEDELPERRVEVHMRSLGGDAREIEIERMDAREG